MIERFAVSCLALALCTAGCQTRAPDFTPQDAAAIRAIFDSVVTEVRAGNWDAWAAHFTEDAHFQPEHLPALVGRPAILAWGKALPHFEAFSFEQLVVFRRNPSGHWLVQAVSSNSDLPLPQAAPSRRK